MSQEQLSKVWSMIQNTRFAMLTTIDHGILRSRPMAASQTDFDGVLWFFTREHSAKVDETGAHPQINVSYADPSDQNYVSLSGTTEIVTDKTTLAHHWTEKLRTWFPRGLDDPEIALLKVTIAQAEYWDAPNSVMVYAYGYLKARLTGESPDPGDHGRITL